MSDKRAVVDCKRILHAESGRQSWVYWMGNDTTDERMSIRAVLHVTGDVQRELHQVEQTSSVVRGNTSSPVGNGPAAARPASLPRAKARASKPAARPS